MALYTDTPHFRAADALLQSVADMADNLPGDFRRLIRKKIDMECAQILVVVFRVNAAADKSPHLAELLERLHVLKLLLRIGMDKRLAARIEWLHPIDWDHHSRIGAGE
ncbi:MAG TPA: four helix bundle protein [Paraburkholderia sp.]|nr:four helix bundle protein [Paraburkholderia sp.]